MLRSTSVVCRPAAKNRHRQRSLPVRNNSRCSDNPFHDCHVDWPDKVSLTPARARTRAQTLRAHTGERTYSAGHWRARRAPFAHPCGTLRECGGPRSATPQRRSSTRALRPRRRVGAGVRRCELRCGALRRGAGACSSSAAHERERGNQPRGTPCGRHRRAVQARSQGWPHALLRLRSTNPPWGHVNSFDELRLLSLMRGWRPSRIDYVGQTRSVTNAVSARLLDYAGHPFGTYDQDEFAFVAGPFSQRRRSATYGKRLRPGPPTGSTLSSGRSHPRAETGCMSALTRSAWRGSATVDSLPQARTISRSTAAISTLHHAEHSILRPTHDP